MMATALPVLPTIDNTELTAIPIEIDRTYKFDIGCTCLGAVFLWCFTFVLVVKIVLEHVWK
jgi:hypothetical protein